MCTYRTYISPFHEYFCDVYLIAPLVAAEAGIFPVEPPPTPPSAAAPAWAARWASSRAAALLAATAASMKLSVEISSASDLLKREFIPLPKAKLGDEAEGTLQ